MLPLFEVGRRHAAESITVVGLITTLLAGFMGLAQTRHQAVVAYSTLEQLGSCSSRSARAHVGCGDVLSVRRTPSSRRCSSSAAAPSSTRTDDQEVDKLGGLWKKMPITAHDVPHRRAGDGGPDPALRLLGEGRDPRHADARRGTALASSSCWLRRRITALYMTRLFILHVPRRAEGPARLRARARVRRR